MLKHSGFTLVELLVAISITAVVFGIIITSASILQKNARDADRKSDLLKIQSALEHYYADYNSYPQTLSPFLTSPTPYLREIPQDPSSGNYGYSPLPSGCTTCINYCIYGKLENPASSDPQPGIGQPCLDTNYNYYLIQP